MELNLDKCKVIYFSNKNKRKEYTMLDQKGVRHKLESSTIERDLGVHITADMKWRNQCQFAAAKANRILGMLGRTFTSRDSTIWKLLYTSLVRPHLEFASTVWNLYTKGDIKILEKVQAKATKMISAIRNLIYEERLCELNWTTLETRRHRGDLIEFNKIINGQNPVIWKSRLK